MYIFFHISLFAFSLHQPFPTCINIVHLSHRSLIYIDRPVQYLITPDIKHEQKRIEKKRREKKEKNGRRKKVYGATPSLSKSDTVPTL
jgi:hypothetical protein